MRARLGQVRKTPASVQGRRVPDGKAAALPRAGRAHAAVAAVLGSRIVRGEFPPGGIIPNETSWATDFKVSRSVVREAIKMLTAKNLLTSRPKIGSRVEPKENWNLLDHEVLAWYLAGPNRGTILRSLQQFRHIIEPEAAALAAVKRSSAQMEVISRACADMASAPNLARRSDADVRFHLAILKASGNELLVPLGVLIDSALNNLFVLTTREAGDLHHAQDLHYAIEKAIRQKKANAARIAVRRLLDNSDKLIAKWADKSARRAT